MTDTILTVVAGIIQLAITWYTGHIFLERRNRAYAVIVWSLGLLAVGLSAVTTYRGVTASSVLDEKMSELKSIQNTPSRTPPPINVKFDTKALAKALSETKQNAAQPREAEKPAPLAIDPLKVEAVELSSDILTFLSDRASGTPNIVKAMISQQGSHESLEEYKKRINGEMQAYTDYRSDTVSRYQTRFEPRALEILGKLKDKGVDVSTVWFKPNTPESIEAFALGLVTVTNRLM